MLCHNGNRCQAPFHGKVPGTYFWHLFPLKELSMSILSTVLCLPRCLLRVAAVAAFVGVIALVAGTTLHPMHADPADMTAAFAEYAVDDHWRLSGISFSSPASP